MADPSSDFRLRVVRRLADEQGGALSRRQLYAAGLSRWEVAGHVRAGRWVLVSDQAVCVHNGPMSPEGHWWAAVIQGGPRRGLPPPERQVLRKDARGRYYLDLYWPTWHLIVEVDGIHHAWAENIIGDALRQNTLVLKGDTVLRLPLLGLRLRPEEFFDQIEEALRRAGCGTAA